MTTNEAPTTRVYTTYTDGTNLPTGWIISSSQAPYSGNVLYRVHQGDRVVLSSESQGTAESFIRLAHRESTEAPETPETPETPAPKLHDRTRQAYITGAALIAGGSLALGALLGGIIANSTAPEPEIPDTFACKVAVDLGETLIGSYGDAFRASALSQLGARAKALREASDDIQGQTPIYVAAVKDCRAS